MNTPLRYTLGKTERLKSRKQIELLFKEGKSFSVFPYRIIYLLQDAEQLTDTLQIQAAFSVSKKYFNKAVCRNRIKRLTREAYRLQKHSLLTNVNLANKRLNVFFVYTGNELPEYNLVFEKITKALQILQTQLHEKNTHSR